MVYFDLDEELDRAYERRMAVIDELVALMEEEGTPLPEDFAVGLDES